MPDRMDSTERNARIEDRTAWTDERSYWQQHYSSRPYAKSDRDFETYEPGYRYGFESARRHEGRDWREVEPELRQGWDGYEHRGESRSTWDEIKDSVRDAWDRVTGGDDDEGRRR